MKKSKIYLHQDADGTYVASCPGLIGNSTAKGRTRWEAMENMRELIYGSNRRKASLSIPWRVEDTNVKVR